MLRNLFKDATIFVLCVFTLLLFSGKTYSETEVPNEKGQIKESGKLPEWVIKGFWKANGNFYGVGSYSGRFVNERDAYFAALQELSLYQKVNYKIHTNDNETSFKAETNIELAQIVKCSSIMKDYQTLQKYSSGEQLTENDEKGGTLEEYSYEFKETLNGVEAHYYISVNNFIESTYQCSTKDLSETLKRIPIVDTYIHRKNGRVGTFVLIKYSEKYLEELEKEESMQKK